MIRNDTFQLAMNSCNIKQEHFHDGHESWRCVQDLDRPYQYPDT